MCVFVLIRLNLLQHSRTLMLALGPILPERAVETSWSAGGLHPQQASELEMVSSPQDRSGCYKWDVALHVQGDSRPPQ